MRHGAMTRWWWVMVAAIAIFGVGCGDDEDGEDGEGGETQNCPDFCGSGSTCVNDVCVPLPCEPACADGQTCVLGECVRTDCEPACADGEGCVNGRCVAVVVACDPACGAGFACVDGACVATAVVCDPACEAGFGCVDGTCVALEVACDPACEAGFACVEGACVALEVTCDPACEAGFGCVEGACVALEVACDPICEAGFTCVEGACVELATTCDPGCGPCEVCDTTGEGPACVQLCGDGESCVDGVCSVTNVHEAMLRGPFDNGPQVTAACLQCHAQSADHLLRSAHFKWSGPTPDLVGHEGATNLGKKNFINNFCIAVASNEKRCTQCHTGYGSDPVKDAAGVVISGGPAYKFPEPGKADCLICHADLGSSKYTKGAGIWGGAAVAGIADPAADPLYADKLRETLLIAAKSVGSPKRDNCGFCHFGAGGGDNVKMGDLASSLKNPARDADVHMGTGSTCVTCHATSTHQPPGSGASVVVKEGELLCTGTCHTETPHQGGLAAALDNHAQDIACQTCHVPAFGRQLPGKMNWDWSTAGDKQACMGFLPCVGGVSKTMVDGHEVEQYNWMKGTFTWVKNVRPAYAWYDGRATHMLTTDAFDPALGLDPSTPVRINGPVATIGDAPAKIYPFKHMTGRQAAAVDGSFLIAPHLFGVDGFWGKRADGTAVVPAQYDATTLEAIWSEIFTFGAKAAGQLPANAASLMPADWRWVETEMFMNINHEVAPKEAALQCANCHGSPDFDFAALGYACDPMGGGACGSRH